MKGKFRAGVSVDCEWLWFTLHQMSHVVELLGSQAYQASTNRIGDVATGIAVSNLTIIALMLAGIPSSNTNVAECGGR